MAGLAGLHAAAGHEGWRMSLGLDETSRVLVIGTEGATDRAIYDRLVGQPPQAAGQLESA